MEWEEKVGDRDTWQAYLEAMVEEYQHTCKGGMACEQIGTLKYKGDIKAFMT